MSFGIAMHLIKCPTVHYLVEVSDPRYVELPGFPDDLSGVGYDDCQRMQWGRHDESVASVDIDD